MSGKGWDMKTIRKKLISLTKNRFFRFEAVHFIIMLILVFLNFDIFGGVFYEIIYFMDAIPLCVEWILFVFDYGEFFQLLQPKILITPMYYTILTLPISVSVFIITEIYRKYK